MALLRLVAQRVAGPGCADATDVVRLLTAVQAQDLRGALTSVALRTEGRGRAGVVAALDAGEIVRSWPMRGTLHLVVTQDLLWMLELMTPRVLLDMVRRRAEFDLDEAAVEHAREVAVGALSGGGRLRRAELLTAWQQAGVVTTGQRGYHLIAHLAMTGTLCFGPLQGNEQLLVLVEEWGTEPRLLGREEALGELAFRYFTGHGPATLADFVRWTGLRVADSRAGLAVARPQLETLDVDGVEHLMHPHTADVLATCRPAARKVFLLPGFDELMLGYRDRSAMLPPQYADRLVPGGNGVFQPTVVSTGRVVGTWKRPKQGVVATPFTTFPRSVEAAITRLAAALP